MAPTPIRNINMEGSTTNTLHSRNSVAGWFKTLIGSKETRQPESYQLGNLSPQISEPGLSGARNIGSVSEQGLPKTPTTETFYSSPHHIKGIADWFKALTGSSKKPQPQHVQDQDESYELDNLIPWAPTVSRYPPKIPELDLGPAFHVGDIFRRDLQTSQMRFSRRIDDDVSLAIIGGMAVFFLVLVLILPCKKILGRSGRS